MYTGKKRTEDDMIAWTWKMYTRIPAVDSLSKSLQLIL